MRRILVIIMIVALQFCAIGCNSSTKPIKPEDPISFYYCSHSSDFSSTKLMIGAESREALGHRDDPEYLIQLYLNGPLSYEYSSPFPMGITLQCLTVQDGNADITLSNQIAALTDYDATLAFACLVMTVGEIIDINSVTIRAEGTLINDNPYLTFNTNDFAFPQSGNN